MADLWHLEYAIPGHSAVALPRYDQAHADAGWAAALVRVRDVPGATATLRHNGAVVASYPPVPARETPATRRQALEDALAAVEAVLVHARNELAALETRRARLREELLALATAESEAGCE